MAHALHRYFQINNLLGETMGVAIPSDTPPETIAAMRASGWREVAAAVAQQAELPTYLQLYDNAPRIPSFYHTLFERLLTADALTALRQTWDYWVCGRHGEYTACYTNSSIKRENEF